MRVYLPTDNPITRGYVPGHSGYDFAGLNRPDEVRSGKDGEIIERIDTFATNWTNSGKLTTRDYGNYIKVKHNDGTFALFAHLKQGSALSKGTKVKTGQIIARIGNTGNSTGPHLHAEYRTSGNINTKAEFYKDVNPSVDPNTHADNLTKMLNWDLVANKLKIDPLDKLGGEKVIEKYKTIENQLADRTRSLTEKEAELETARSEREQAISKVCPNPSAHLGNPSSGETGSDSSTVPVPIDDHSSGIPTDPAGSGQVPQDQNIIDALIALFKKLVGR